MPIEFGPEYVRRLAPYQAGKPISEVAREFGLDEAGIVKLASNENPLGMPESARKAMLAAVVGHRALSGCQWLRAEAGLSAKYDVPEDWITLGNGSNDILELAAHAFVQKHESIVYSEYSFAVYALATQGVGARAIVVPSVHYGHDLGAMARAIEADTRLVFIANPNNPTGTFVPAAEIEKFLVAVPPEVVVVLDEAYNEYLAPRVAVRLGGLGAHIPEPAGLAHHFQGLRAGRPARRLCDRPAGADRPDQPDRQPFNVNSLAQAAAVAALNDRQFLHESAQMNAAGYVQLTEAFDATGHRVRAVVRQLRADEGGQ